MSARLVVHLAEQDAAMVGALLRHADREGWLADLDPADAGQLRRVAAMCSAVGRLSDSADMSDPGADPGDPRWSRPTLPAAEAGVLLGVSARHVGRLAERGELRGWRERGRWLLDTDSVRERWQRQVGRTA